jgi:hypothetical protein
MNLKKQMSDEFARLQEESRTLTDSIEKAPLFLDGQRRLQEAWDAKGKPGLDALLELQKEFGPWLEKVSGLNWARLESAVASIHSLLALREAEDLSARLRDQIGGLIRQAERIPDKIKCLDPRQELAHFHGCKGSDFIMAEIMGPEIALDYRSRIRQLGELLQRIKIKARPGEEAIHIIEPFRPEMPNGPARAETAFNVFGLDVDRQLN